MTVVAIHSPTQITVNTVADMLALSTSGDYQVLDGYRVETLGRTVIGTGSNRYYYDASSAATIDGGFVMPGIGGALSFDAAGVFNGTAGIGRFLAADTSTITSTQWGLIEDGVTDEIATIRRMTTALTSGRKLEFDRTGTVILSDRWQINNRSDFHIDFGGITIKAQNGRAVANSQQIIYMQGCRRFTLSNGVIDGNRGARTPAAVTAHSIQLMDCRDFILSNVQSVDAVVDGFYMGAPDDQNISTYCINGLVENCVSENSFRQGMSIVSGYGIMVRGGRYNGTNGNAPQAGIDIEADIAETGGGEAVNKSITIDGVEFQGNAGAGVLVSGQRNEGTRVVNCFFDGNQVGLSITASTYAAGNTFVNQTNGTANGVIEVLSSAGNYAIGTRIIGNNIIGSTAAGLCAIYIHNNVPRCVVAGNNIESCQKAMKLFGVDTIAYGNTIKDIAEDPAISISGSRAKYFGNSMDGYLGRAIFVGGPDISITDNSFVEGATITVGTIHVSGATALRADISGNLFTQSAATAFDAIYVNNSGSAFGSNNKMTNFDANFTTIIAPSTLRLDHTGAGAPAFNASRGSTFTRQDGGAGASWYVKESTDQGLAGWVAK